MDKKRPASCGSVTRTFGLKMRNTLRAQDGSEAKKKYTSHLDRPSVLQGKFSSLPRKWWNSFLIYHEFKMRQYIVE